MFKIIVFQLIHCALFYRVIFCRSTETINTHHAKWVVNAPPIFDNHTWPLIGHRLVQSADNSTFIAKCDNLRGQNPGGNDAFT